MVNQTLGDMTTCNKGREVSWIRYLETPGSVCDCCLWHEKDDGAFHELEEDQTTCNHGREVSWISYLENRGLLCICHFGHEDDDEGVFHTLEDFTTFNPAREVSWTRLIETADYLAILEKIESVFRGVNSFPFKRICFQFWGTGCGRMVLECIRTPRAMTPFDIPVDSYRDCCVKYLYRLSEGDKYNYPFKILSGGLPATAFRSQFPEVVFDLSVHRGSPVVDCALDCELRCCMMLPIFQRHSSQCVGVVECSMKHPRDLLVIFNDMKRELEGQALSIYYVQGSWPYKTITGDLDRAKMEIREGLKIACELQKLTLGQVWISSDASDSANQMKRTMLVKLTGSGVDYADDPLSSLVNGFYDKLDVVALKEGEGGLVWKALQTHKLYFCRNIYKLSDNRGVLGVLSATNIKCASFVICLRSTHTGELDYAFEFFWPQDRDHFALIENLLSTLRERLPSFNFASGRDEMASLNIFQGNKVSETPKDTSVGLKRKFIDTYADQTDSNQLIQSALTNINNPEGEKDEDDDDLPILAFYGDDATLFFLPFSSGLENLRLKLNMEFELDPSMGFKFEYEFLPGQWRFLESLQSCWRTVKDAGLIKLRLVHVSGEVGWKWKTMNT